MTSESAFFNAFLEEGLRFGSSLYLSLIWIRVSKHVFENPNEAADHLKSHPFFKKFVSRTSAESYIDGLCDSLQSICIGSPIKRPTAKHRLSDMLLEEQQSSSEDERTASSKRNGIALESDTEDDALPGTSTMTLEEILDRASSNKKKGNTRKRKSINVKYISISFLLCFVQRSRYLCKPFFYIKLL